MPDVPGITLIIILRRGLSVLCPLSSINPPMAPTLTSLQERLFYADSCYRRPHDLDFSPGATMDNPLLAISTKNLIVLSYRILLSHLRIEAQNLSPTLVSAEAKARLLLLIDNITSRLAVIDHHIRSIFVSRLSLGHEATLCVCNLLSALFSSFLCSQAPFKQSRSSCKCGTFHHLLGYLLLFSRW
jgi:hypothetical protein